MSGVQKAMQIVVDKAMEEKLNLVQSPVCGYTSHGAIPIYLLTSLKQYESFVIEIEQDFVLFC